MFHFFHKSLRNKIFILFASLGLLPFISLLIYMIFLSQTKIVNKTIVEQLDRTDVVVKLINNHLLGLEKEVEFLSHLDVMDDLLAEDLDKRISRLLSQKAEDLNLDIDFFVLNENKVIIASSNKEYISKKFPLFKESSTPYIQNSFLYINTEIKASFDTTQKLGFLVLRYKLTNLDTYMTHNNHIQSYIFNPQNNTTIGKQISLELNLNNDSNYLIDENHVIVYKKFSSFLDGFYIVYTVDKEIALEFLYDFIQFMLAMASILFFFIIYLSIKYSKGIVKPIEDLTQITKEIIKTQNYSVDLEIKSQDEIATLTHSFNEMLKTTNNALEKLENENRLRLKRFTQLIEVFNTIIQTKTEEECISTSTQEIKKITENENLYFQKTPQEDKNEKDFHNSIASMIALQLDRIRLIEKTMSASKAKSVFISSMSHELRTPLNAIIGFAQYLIVYENLNEEQVDTISNIESSAQYLLSMINEILDIAKIESGNVEVHYQNVYILNLVEQCVEMLSPLAYDKDLELIFEYKNFTNQELSTDAKMFKQILINLLSNAIKFTQKGSIQVKLEDDEENIYITIIDTGIGIEKEDIDKLFHDFTQLKNEMQTQHKGTGLGLSIGKKMAKILGGDIILKSQGLNKGVESLFTIPKRKGA